MKYLKNYSTPCHFFHFGVQHFKRPQKDKVCFKIFQSSGDNLKRKNIFVIFEKI